MFFSFSEKQKYYWRQNPEAPGVDISVPQKTFLDTAVENGYMTPWG